MYCLCLALFQCLHYCFTFVQLVPCPNISTYLSIMFCYYSFKFVWFITKHTTVFFLLRPIFDMEAAGLFTHAWRCIIFEWLSPHNNLCLCTYDTYALRTHKHKSSHEFSLCEHCVCASVLTSAPYTSQRDIIVFVVAIFAVDNGAH